MDENPFAPYAPALPPVFVDREREVDLIFSHIRSTQRGNVAVSGPLGIGKTSLLRYVSDPRVAASQGVEPPAYISLYVDVHAVAPFSAARFWRRVAQLLPRFADSDVAASAARLSGESIDILELEEFLDGLAARGTTLVLLLDEFEWVLETDNGAAESRNFLAQLASLARRTPRSLSLVVATQQPLAEVTRTIPSWRGSPFATVFSVIELKPLGRTHCDRLFRMALGEADDVLSPAEREQLYLLTGGQPAVVQAVAFALYHERMQSKRGSELWAAADAAAARARAVVQPSVAPETAPTPESERMPPVGLWIDSVSGDVFVDANRIESLTALEYSLLQLLYSQPRRLHTKEEIIRAVWGAEFVGHIDDSRVEKLVSRLRHKIEPVTGRPQFIRTVRGRGYRYMP